MSALYLYRTSVTSDSVACPILVSKQSLSNPFNRTLPLPLTPSVMCHTILDILPDVCLSHTHLLTLHFLSLLSALNVPLNAGPTYRACLLRAPSTWTEHTELLKVTHFSTRVILLYCPTCSPTCLFGLAIIRYYLSKVHVQIEGSLMY